MIVRTVGALGTRLVIGFNSEQVLHSVIELIEREWRRAHVARMLSPGEAGMIVDKNDSFGFKQPKGFGSKTVATKLFRTSNFIGPGYHEALLFQC